jgi:hypothetical protein
MRGGGGLWSYINTSIHVCHLWYIRRATWENLHISSSSWKWHSQRECTCDEGRRGTVEERGGRVPPLASCTRLHVTNKWVTTSEAWKRRYHNIQKHTYYHITVVWNDSVLCMSTSPLLHLIGYFTRDLPWPCPCLWIREGRRWPLVAIRWLHTETSTPLSTNAPVSDRPEPEPSGDIIGTVAQDK